MCLIRRFGEKVEERFRAGARAFDYLDAPIERVGSAFTPVPFALVMEQYVILQEDDVMAAVKRMVARS